jgi:alpha/beta superfamily hydrolase
MYDGVVDSIANGCHLAGMLSLRFNFRGVGASQGEHDGGAGEGLDLQHVCKWFARQHAITHLCLAGYSFGAGIVAATQSAVGQVVQAQILVAPPASMLPQLSDPAEEFSGPVLILLGSNDQFIDAGQVTARFASSNNVNLRIIDGADHFFQGQDELIRKCTRDFILTQSD